MAWPRSYAGNYLEFLAVAGEEAVGRSAGKAKGNIWKHGGIKVTNERLVWDKKQILYYVSFH